MATIDTQFATATTCVNGDLTSLLNQLNALAQVPPTGGGGGGGGGIPSPITGALSGPFQISLGGVIMDACDPCAPLHVTKFFTGLGVAPKRDADVKRMQHHGSFPSPQYFDVRHLLWDVMPTGVDPTDLRDNIQTLCGAFIPQPDDLDDPTVPLVFTLDDPFNPFVVFGKPGQVPIDYAEFLHSVHYGTPDMLVDPCTCEFICTDPVIYGSVLHSDTTGFGAASGGLGFPFSFPFGFGASLPGTATIANAGNMPTYPTFLFTAGGTGLSDIQVINTDTGEAWSITLSLGIGDVLIVDMAAHTVLLNGTESRGAFVNRPPSVWFAAAPGNTDLLFLGTGIGSSMEVRWRDAYQF